MNLWEENVLRGNAAILKCHIPSFVTEYVAITSWIISEGDKDVQEINLDSDPNLGNGECSANILPRILSLRPYLRTLKKFLTFVPLFLRNSVENKGRFVVFDSMHLKFAICFIFSCISSIRREILGRVYFTRKCSHLEMSNSKFRFRIRVSSFLDYFRRR